MLQAGQQLPELAVSDDFNSKLLNRIAQERFAETRTKAYLPRRAPVILWRQAIPAFATACLVVLLAVVVLSPQFKNGDTRMTDKEMLLDDSYLYAQPTNATCVRENWSFKQQLTQIERMNRISRAILRQAGWINVRRTATWATSSTPHNYRPVPSMPTYYKTRLVVPTAVSPEPPPEKEIDRAY
jgi:hypothetical protein